jgi:hypothetical protein
MEKQFTSVKSVILLMRIRFGQKNVKRGARNIKVVIWRLFTMVNC